MADQTTRRIMECADLTALLNPVAQQYKSAVESLRDPPGQRTPYRTGRIFGVRRLDVALKSGRKATRTALASGSSKSGVDPAHSNPLPPSKSGVKPPHSKPDHAQKRGHAQRV